MLILPPKSDPFASIVKIRKTFLSLHCACHTPTNCFRASPFGFVCGIAFDASAKTATRERTTVEISRPNYRFAFGIIPCFAQTSHIFPPRTVLNSQKAFPHIENRDERSTRALFIAQREHWIDASGALGRNGSGDQRNTDERRGDCRKR